MTSTPLYLCTRHYHFTSVPECLREINRDSTKHSRAVIEPRSGVRDTSHSPSLPALQDRSLSMSVKLTEMSWHNALRFWTRSLWDEHDSSQIRFRATRLDTCNYVVLCLDKQNSIVMHTTNTDKAQLQPCTFSIKELVSFGRLIQMFSFQFDWFKSKQVNRSVFISQV